MASKINLDGVSLTLSTPDTHEVRWIDCNDYLLQLGAAWLRLSDDVYANLNVFYPSVGN
jgi:hypothetical protein